MRQQILNCFSSQKSIQIFKVQLSFFFYWDCSNDGVEQAGVIWEVTVIALGKYSPGWP